MSTLPSGAVALEVAAPSQSTSFSSWYPGAASSSQSGYSGWLKSHRGLVALVSVLVATVLLAGGGVLYYFLSYQPNHSSSSSSAVNNPQTHQEFLTWMDRHGKAYTNSGEQTAAFDAWLHNFQQIHQANQAGSSVKYILGPYADLSHSQFQQQILTLQRTVPRSNIAPATNTKSVKAAETLNWANNAGMVSPIKNQGQCGDCWAFSASEAFEVAYNVAYQPSTSIELSPQQITACDTNDNGCGGGDPVNVYQNYLGPNSGNKLTTEANYPFTAGGGTAGTCDTAAAATGFVQLNSWSYAVQPTETWSQNAEDQLIQALQTSPVTICVDASPWQNYGGGVLSNSAGGCTGRQADLDHAVQLVGYTATYWIVKNQWSTSWGDNGYIYLARGDNTCGLFNEATQVSVSSTLGGPTAGPGPSTDPATNTPTPTNPATNPPNTDPYVYYGNGN